MNNVIITHNNSCENTINNQSNTATVITSEASANGLKKNNDMNRENVYPRDEEDEDGNVTTLDNMNKTLSGDIAVSLNSRNNSNHTSPQMEQSTRKGKGKSSKVLENVREKNESGNKNAIDIRQYSLFQSGKKVTESNKNSRIDIQGKGLQKNAVVIPNTSTTTPTLNTPTLNTEAGNTEAAQRTLNTAHKKGVQCEKGAPGIETFERTEKSGSRQGAKSSGEEMAVSSGISGTDREGSGISGISGVSPPRSEHFACIQPLEIPLIIF